jgi:23S rRNA-/tRNA-specific pseudouridylate synthase
MGITHWKNLGEEKERTRILFSPVTGRTHQLRLHAAHRLGLGVPIVGDSLYGNGQDGDTMFCMPADCPSSTRLAEGGWNLRWHHSGISHVTSTNCLTQSSKDQVNHQNQVPSRSLPSSRTLCYKNMVITGFFFPARKYGRL